MGEPVGIRREGEFRPNRHQRRTFLTGRKLRQTQDGPVLEVRGFLVSI